MEEASKELQAELADAIATANVAMAEGILDAYARRHSHQAGLTELLQPVLSEIGAQWNVGKPTVLAQSYLAAKLTERMLMRTLEEGADARPAAVNLGTVVVGNIEDDYHALGRRMVGTFLKAAGWSVIDLGNDVPPEAFLLAAREYHARVIGVSAMMYLTATNIRRVREAIDAAGLTQRVQLAVGGAVFNLRPELVAEVGGDGTTRTAVSAPELFGELFKKSEACGLAP